jgi:hypothetical protein
LATAAPGGMVPTSRTPRTPKVMTGEQHVEASSRFALEHVTEGS